MHQVRLPTSGGHDLQPVYGHEDRLWVSTQAKVYQYSIAMDQFDENYPGCERISRAHVKSVGNTPSGLVLSAAPDGMLRPDTGAADNDWCTDGIDCYQDAGHSFEAAAAQSRVRYRLPGVALYKARVWIH